jgi:phosphoglycerate dehydrogenase-like enzyme/glyoxylase-like metal-dependent hydrolase (beta-lactamase superfamily II)
MRTLLTGGIVLVLCSSLPAADDNLAKMKFGEVREIASGVFFRYSAISATDKSVVFGGSNNIWVVFDEFVVVIDANFPRGAGEVIEAVRKTTDKPIRYVFDTHHHGDHAWGNGVFAKAGASVVAQANCARILRTTGPKDYADGAKGPNAREDVKTAPFKAADVVFDDRLVVDDGKQRIEFLHFGHGHTAGDAVAYLPHQKILCTGDACVNGAFNYMGQGDSASWIRALERMQQLDIRLICPGHGAMAGKELLQKQKRYFQDLRKEVQKGIDAKTNLDDIIKNLELPWYQEWTGVQPAGDNIKHVYAELTGGVIQWDLTEELGLVEGPSLKEHYPEWHKPKRIVVASGLMPGRLEELKRIAPEVEFVPAKTPEDAATLAGEADAVIGYCTPEVLRAGKKFLWVQAGAAGVEPEAEAIVEKSPAGTRLVVTEARPVLGPSTAERVFSMLLNLTHGPSSRDDLAASELHGKTMLLIGLEGAGKQISRRAHAFGMRVRAIDCGKVEKPDWVFSLDTPDRLSEILPKADVVVIACPLTSETRHLIGSRELKAMKRSAYVIHVSRSAVVDMDALTQAMRDAHLAGAGIDVIDSRSIPADHPLRRIDGVMFAKGQTAPGEAMERVWRLYRENLRRYVAGEPLLCVVERPAPEK